MTTDRDPALERELEGLGHFVDELRAIEAPGMSLATPGITRVPTLTLTSGLRRRGLWSVGVAIAGVAATVVVVARRDGATARDSAPAAGATASTISAGSADTAPRAASSTNDLAAMLTPWPAVAYAQGTGKPTTERYAPLIAFDLKRLRVGRRVYVRSSANDYHASLPHEIWTNTLDSVRYRGAKAWQLVRSIDRIDTRGRGYGLVDTLWLRATDLRPIARHSNQQSLYTSNQQFTDSTVVELDTIRMPKGFVSTLPASARRRLPMTHTTRRTFEPSSPFVASSEMLRVLLQAAPLAPGWRASVQVPRNVYNAIQPNQTGWVNLRVAGLDTVQLFGGRFPSWRVLVESNGPPETWFVSRETGETLITDGPLSVNYPESRTVLLYGLEETERVPPIRRR